MSTQFAGQLTQHIMAATTHEPPLQSPIRASIQVHTSTYTVPTLDTHIWLVDSATSRHLSGNLELFHSLHYTTPVTKTTADDRTFIVNQQGDIHTTIMSDPSYGLPDVPITLTNVMHVPNLMANLLLVGQMTNANVCRLGPM